MRLDIFLYNNGYAKSRSAAKSVLESNSVFVNGKPVRKPAYDVCKDDLIEIKGDVCPYVGRGGLKLERALREFNIDVNGSVCLDIGASTGGFTDCLLQNGARRVYALDCGHGQLDKKIENDSRVVNLEGINARDIPLGLIPEKVNVCTMDVSFISQTLIHHSIPVYLTDGGYFITLIKPQFEVGRFNIGKNGIVKNDKAIEESIIKICESAYSLGFEKIGVCDSPIKGGDGNREYIGVFKLLRN